MKVQQIGDGSNVTDIARVSGGLCGWGVRRDTMTGDDDWGVGGVRTRGVRVVIVHVDGWCGLGLVWWGLRFW